MVHPWRRTSLSFFLGKIGLGVVRAWKWQKGNAMFLSGGKIWTWSLRAHIMHSLFPYLCRHKGKFLLTGNDPVNMLWGTPMDPMPSMYGYKIPAFCSYIVPWILFGLYSTPLEFQFNYEKI